MRPKETGVLPKLHMLMGRAHAVSILYALSTKPGEAWPVSVAGKKVGLDPQRLGQVARHLERFGLVTVAEVPGRAKEKAYSVRITPEGRTILGLLEAVERTLPTPAAPKDTIKRKAPRTSS